jgi:ABC-type multidrug transport system ATPase subunit
MIQDPTNIPIECDHLGKNFGSRMALREVTLSVSRGEICALIGPNGSGKTTLLKILAGLIVPSGGTARICGEDVARNPRKAGAKIGFTSSEERSFYWRLTGRQNLKFFIALHNINGADGKMRIDSLLAKMGLKEMGDRRFREYSTGMKQALSITRALLHDPPVLLLDEPTRSLSPDVSLKFYELVRFQSGEGKTILFASQNLIEVERMADSVVILHKGDIRAAGTVAELRRQAGLSDDKGLETVYSCFTGELVV